MEGSCQQSGAEEKELSGEPSASHTGNQAGPGIWSWVRCQLLWKENDFFLKWAVEGSHLRTETPFSRSRKLQQILRNTVMWQALLGGHLENGLDRESKLWVQTCCTLPGCRCSCSITVTKEAAGAWGARRLAEGLPGVGQGGMNPPDENVGWEDKLLFLFCCGECEQVFGRWDTQPTESNACCQLWLLYNLGTQPLRF